MIVFKNNSNSEGTNDFKDLIYIVRGVQVMLDSDLAGINQQVKNYSNNLMRISGLNNPQKSTKRF